MSKSTKLTARVTGNDGSTRHFFASSAAEWKVDTDPAKLIAYMKKQGYPFNMWMVPVSISANYEINYFSPQVEGSVWLCAYLFD